MVVRNYFSIRILRLLLALAISVLFFAQGMAQGYSRQYYENRPLMMFGSIEQKSEFSYVTGITGALDTPHYAKAMFGKVDQNGNFIYLKGIMDSLPYSYDLFWNNLKQTSDGNFIMCGEMVDSTKKIFILKMDTLGHIVFKKEYKDSSFSFFQAQDILQLSGGGYLIAANVIWGGDQLVLMIQIDSIGLIINKTIHDLSNKEYPVTMRRTLNGNIMVGAVSHNVFPYVTKTWLIEIDSAGAMVNQWLDSDPTNMWPYGMEQTTDSGWILVREHLAYDVSGNHLYIGSVLKLDKDFHKQWEIIAGDTGFDTGFYDVAILPDGKYIVAGTTPTWDIGTVYQWGWIMKIDTDGTVIWDKKYAADRSQGTANYLYDIDILPNGDLLACGEIQYTYDVGIRPIQQGWILRTDSNGCVMDNCTVGIQETPKPSGVLQVYPNPFNSNLTLTVTGTNGVIGTASITITNPLGQTLYSQQEANLSSSYTKLLNLSYLPNGLYFLSLEINGERTVRQIVKE